MLCQCKVRQKAARVKILQYYCYSTNWPFINGAITLV
ncbi:uncharacterized protein METZ01_LOCUS508097, partial [marine metagenome]